MRRSAKRRQRLGWAACAIIICLLGGWIMGSVMKIHSYRTRLKQLQLENNQLPGLRRAEELQNRLLARDQRLQLLRDLEDTCLPWPTLLREMEGIYTRGIALRKIAFEADGRVVLWGKALELADIALFLSTLDSLPSLDVVDLDYVKADEAGGWTFDIIGWVRTKGWSRADL